MIDKQDMKLRRHLKTFISARMQELQFSEADLARITGDSPTQINRIVRGINTPTLTFAARLAAALEVSLDELAGAEELAKT